MITTTPSKEASLVLQSIRPEENRYRVYAITIAEMIIMGERLFAIKRAWGRLGHQMKSRTIFCSSKAELDKTLQTTLRARLRHRYRIREKDPHFPKIEIFSSFPSTQSFKQTPSIYRLGRQLMLF